MFIFLKFSKTILEHQFSNIEASLASGSVSIYSFPDNSLLRLYRQLLSDTHIGIENTQEDVRKVMGLSSEVQIGRIAKPKKIARTVKHPG